MSLDSISIGLIADKLQGRSILCLGYPELPDGNNTIEWLKTQGATQVDVVDVIQHVGCERYADLNTEQEWPQQYGLVINPGTVEHCFNIGMAWRNAWTALEVGGYVMHICPSTMLNHGFWNISPVALLDWCELNGGHVDSIQFATNGTRAPVKVERINGASGRGCLPPETVMYAVCQKIAAVPPNWPAQGVYRK